MDKSPNTGKPTGGHKQPPQNNNHDGDAESSAVTPPPPPPPPPAPHAATQDVVPTETTPPVTADASRVPPFSFLTAHARIVTTPGNAGDGSGTTAPVTTPVRIAPTQANPGAGGSRGRGGAEQRASASSVIMYTRGTVEASQSKRRNRTDYEVGGSSSRPRLEGEMVGIPAPCWVCGKQFGSWKALFGHMRSHPDRPWRGVFPPPTFNREGSPENSESQPQHHQQQEIVQVQSENDLASTLLNLAKGCLDRIGGAGPSSGQERIVFDVDLNVALEPLDSPSPPPLPRSPSPPPEEDGNGHRVLDLNKSPPEE